MNILTISIPTKWNRHEEWYTLIIIINTDRSKQLYRVENASHPNIKHNTLLAYVCTPYNIHLTDLCGTVILTCEWVRTRHCDCDGRSPGWTAACLTRGIPSKAMWLTRRARVADAEFMELPWIWSCHPSPVQHCSGPVITVFIYPVLGQIYCKRTCFLSWLIIAILRLQKNSQ